MRVELPKPSGLCSSASQEGQGGEAGVRAGAGRAGAEPVAPPCLRAMALPASSRARPFPSLHKECLIKNPRLDSLLIP